jgi:hypothetical protein
VTTVAYATTEQLAAWLPDDADAELISDRLLQRASELLDDYIRQPFALVTDTEDADYGRPSDAELRQLLADACCAQVEFWGNVGEDHDIEGLGGQSVSIMSYSGPLPDELSPRARRLLAQGGLLSVPNGTLDRVIL